MVGAQTGGRMSFLTILRKDRFLAIGYLLLAAVGLWPLTMTPLLPFIDLNLTASHGAMLFDVADSHHPVSQYYAINWAPVPYWTSYLIAAVADAIAGTLFAAKALVGLWIVLLPAATIRLLAALKRDPRLGLWAFLLNWERNLWGGWVAYLLGMALALWALAWLLETDSWRQALKVTALAALIALTHIQALGFLAIAGMAMTVAQKLSWRRIRLNVLALSGGLLAILPWLYKLFEHVPSGVKAVTTWRFVEHTAAQKMNNLYVFTFDTFAGKSLSIIPVAVFLCLIVGPLIIAALARPMRAAPLAPALVVFFSALLLYLVLPFAVSGLLTHKHTYVRYASFMLLGLLLIPRTRLRGRQSWALWPGIVLALLMGVHMTKHLRGFGQRVQPFTALFGLVEAGAQVLPIINNRKDPACKMSPSGSFHGMLAGAARAFDPYFFRTHHIPIIYRRRRLPAVRSTLSNVSRRNVMTQLRGYDYALVQGLRRDPFRAALAAGKVRLVKEAGMWRLYAVVKPAAAKPR